MSMEIVNDGEEPPEPLVSINVDDAIDCVDVEWLQKYALLAVVFLGKEKSEISVRVVNDGAMSVLHETHSGESGTTDVLTFDHGTNEFAIIADIAICSDVAQRVAEERGHSMSKELMLYIVHGMLHCIGLDDHDDDSHRMMHAEEDRVLSAIGVGSVWSSGS